MDDFELQCEIILAESHPFTQDDLILGFPHPRSADELLGIGLLVER